MGAHCSFLPRRIALWSLAAALILPGVLGCGSDSSPTSSGDSSRPSHRAGILQGRLNPGSVDFEILSLANGDPDNPEPGPYVLRGRNLSFDAEAGGITVDLSVENVGTETYPEPLTLTFISLAPEGVTVDNSENGESGAGAGFTFSLPDDDGQWTPNEETLPRMTMFGVDPGVSISFVARVDAGSGLGGMGSIGGIVFDDENGNGVMDEGEGGVAGVTLELSREGMDARTTMTAADGSYRFDGLEAGFYRVEKLASEGMVPTTPVEFYVTLTENQDGEVNTFLNANFGCQVEGGSGLPLEDGDCVKVDGYYDAESGVLVAKEIHVQRHWHCDDDDDDGGDDDDDGDDGDDDGDDGDDDDGDWDDDKTGGGYGNCGKMELRGLVTDRDSEARVIEIMNTRVKLVGWWKTGDRDHHDDEIEVGDRARVDVFKAWPQAEEDYFGHKLKTWNGRKDRVRGFVHDIGDDQFQVLGTTIQVTPETEWED